MPSNTNLPECPVKLVPNTLGKQLGLTACWVKEHQFATLAFSNVKNQHAAQRKQPAPGAGSRPPVVDIQHFDVDLVLDEPTVRTMVNDCGRVFYQLQQLRYGLAGRQTQTIDFVEQSLRYRTIVRQALDKLNRLLSESSQAEAQEDAPSYHSQKSYRDFVALFYSIECTWHLLEFLLLDSNNSTTVVAPLLEWIRHHYPTPALDAAELLSSGRQIDLPDNYWSVVKALILQGQTTIARALLRLHVAADTQSFSTVDQLLHSFPIYTVYGGLSVHKFRSQWNCWTGNVRTLLATGHFADEPNLEELLRLVTGDRQAWKEQLAGVDGAWYEHFPGFLLYTDSTCKYYELPEHVNEWMELFREAHSLSTGTSKNTLLDNLVLAVMENDLIKLLHQVQQLPDNGWFAVHLVDLLYHAGQLDLGRSRLPDEDGTGGELAPAEDGLVDNGKLMRESLLYEFGTMLMTHRTLWLLGMDYLEFSNTLGLGAREVLLGRIPLRNERDALKVFAIARKNGYRGIATEVCKVQSRRYLALKRYGSALDWANKSGDGGCISEVANIFLEYYCNHGELLCEETIANLGSQMFLSSRLMFLKKYHDFRKYYRDQAYASAAELLVSLMDSKIMPSYFWPCLMSDAIPLLEFKEPIIPSKETLIILEHLQLDLVPMLQRRQQQRKSTETSSTSMPAEDGVASASEDVADEMALVPKFASNLLNNCTEDLIKMLRLACARNLARALIIENTIST